MVKRRIFLSVDVGGTKTLMMLNRERKILAKKLYKTGKTEFLKNLKKNIRQFLEANEMNEKKIYAAGFALPGPFIIKNKLISIKSPNIENYRVIHIESALKRIFRNLNILNDAVCGAISEHEVGALKNANNAIYVTWSTGIGGGLIMDGKVRFGKEGNCGHIGHTIISDKKRKCGCGLYGDMEAMSSGKSIEKMFDNKISAEKIFLKRSKGNKKAKKIIDTAVEYFSKGVFNGITLLDLEIICIGGSVFLKNEKVLLPKIIKFFKKHKNPQSDSIKIVKASLGEESSLFGAFYHTFKKNA